MKTVLVQRNSVSKKNRPNVRFLLNLFNRELVSHGKKQSDISAQQKTPETINDMGC